MISPWAPPNDIVDVCNMSDADDEIIADYCQTCFWTIMTVEKTAYRI